MSKIKELIKKTTEGQFLIKNFQGEKPFAITESTPEDHKYKIICIDLGDGVSRYLEVDWLFLILKDFYGEEYLMETSKKIKPYDKIKNVEIPGLEVLKNILNRMM